MKTPLFATALVIAACSKDVSAPSPAPACAPGGPSSLTLPVGGVAVLSDPNSLACVQIAAAPSATAYLFVTANAVPHSAAASAYRVEAAVAGTSLSAAVSAAPAPPRCPAKSTPTPIPRTSYFGRPTDLDNNGHVFILFTPRINALTKRGSNTFFGGFFFGGDLFPQTGPDACAESNVGEIFYLLVPDPSGVFSDPRQTAFVRQVTRSTIAHELEHMINLGVRIVESNTNPNITQESIWLDEALAHFAEEYLGRAEDGFTPFQRLTYADVSANTNDYNAFYRGNLGNLGLWLQRPDTASTIANTDMLPPDGGAAWSLLHYTGDQYAAGNLSTFTLGLVAGRDSGLPNLTATASVPFDSLMAGWMLAIYADGLGIPGVSSRYGFRSWDFHDAETSGGFGPYPLRIAALAGGSDVTATARPGSGNYFLLTSSPTTPAGMFRLLSPTGSLVSFPGARLYVLRTQ